METQPCILGAGRDHCACVGGNLVCRAGAGFCDVSADDHPDRISDAE